MVVNDYNEDGVNYGRFYCFTCCESGDLFSFIMKKENLSFKESLQKASDYLSFYPLINSSLYQDNDQLSLRKFRTPAKIAIPIKKNVQNSKVESLSIKLEASAKVAEVEDSAAIEENKKQQRVLLKEASRHYTSQLLSSGDSIRARNYLKNRKISPETAMHFEIGYAPPATVWDRFLILESLNTSSTYSIINESQMLQSRSKSFVDTAYSPSSLTALFLKEANWNTSILGDLVQIGLVVNATFQSEEQSLQYRIYDRFRDRLMIPIRNEDGEVVAFGGRLLPADPTTQYQKKSSNKAAKYINSPTSLVFRKKYTLFGLDSAREYIRQCDMAILVEGYMDVISLFEIGIRNVVASLGTAISIEQLVMAANGSSSKTVILLLDNDEAGHNAAQRALKIIQKSSEKTRRQLSDWNGPKDLNDTFQRVNLKLANLSVAYDYIVKNLPLNQHMELTSIKDAADLVIAYDAETARNIINYVLSAAI
eukprot:CAMPEP_0170067252 /NCGR_PEP_ID=MMETSP0019_2-20121128/6675_1 /TAXON_ID=98059 /ORGANISM="Dinobryon sp., Strain UTEXLB2267" /LENGTH=479 /DNA_ID=CAMNT_0010274607 /DNA_START=205 /DNA_END=1644 /DNA_ORIENTATION=-